MYRQGDVLLVPIEPASVPATAVSARRDRMGRAVLAHGEATGHAHVITGPDLRVMVLPDDVDQMFVEIVSRATLSHDEHGPITVPAGHYRVVRQREYVPGSFRPVMD